MEQLKKCSSCEIEKSVSEFSKHSKNKDKLRYLCRNCSNFKKLEWYKNNKDHVNNYNRIYKKNRRINDISFKLACNLRSRLRNALFSQVTKKNSTTEELLGISFEEFKNYIEFFMTPEMTWKTIDLDHVRPLSSFDLTDNEQLKEAAHYTNIQPLLKIDNIKKGSKYHEHDLVVQSEKVYDYETYKYYSNLYL